MNAQRRSNSQCKISRCALRNFLLAVQALSIFLSADALEAANLKSGFSETLIATGLSRPTAMSFAPDGRVFVCQQSGQVRVIKDGVLLSSLIHLTGRGCCRGTRIAGRCVPPKFVLNQFVILYYTAKTPDCTTESVDLRPTGMLRFPEASRSFWISTI